MNVRPSYGTDKSHTRTAIEFVFEQHSDQAFHSSLVVGFMASARPNGTRDAKGNPIR
jgi:hypothetical protein